MVEKEIVGNNVDDENGTRKIIKERKYFYILVGCSLLVIFWLFVYYSSSYFLERKINSMEPVISEADGIITTASLVSLKVGFDDKTYTLQELVDLEELPTVVDVMLIYEDGTLANKQAYISYSDDTTVTDVEYIDNEYGRIILPNRG